MAATRLSLQMQNIIVGLRAKAESNSNAEAYQFRND